MSIFKEQKIGPITKAVIDAGVTTCEHNHPGGSLFDAVDAVDNYISAAYNSGYSKFAVTDHASFSAMQTCIDVAAKMTKNGKPIDIIYGVEGYIEVPPFDIKDRVGHIILLAVTEEGKHIIDKLNSHASATKNGKPVMTVNDLKNIDFDGNVIATSACVSGAPAIQILANDMLDQLIDKERRAQERVHDSEDETDGTGTEEHTCIPPDDEKYLEKKAELGTVNRELEAALAMRDSKEQREQRNAISKQLRAARKAGNKEAVDVLTISYNNITDALNRAKEDAVILRKKSKAIGKEFKVLDEKVQKYLMHEDKIKGYEKLKKSPDELAKAAEDTILYYQDIFGKGNYYIEVQNHGLDMEQRVYPVIAEIARKHNIPLVAANDAHMADGTERSIDMRNVAKFLRMTEISESEADKELYIKTPYELAQALSAILPDDQVAEALNNLNIIGDRCVYVPKKTNHYPIFDKNKNSDELLREETLKGIKWRYPDNEGWDDEHQKRMEYELGIIIQMGFSDYHLIVKDFLEYGRICGKVPMDKLPEVPLTIEGAKKYVSDHGYDVGIGIGIGRGSGAGSLVTYLLGITGIDPFKYNLIFERFLNPERVSMPEQYWAFRVNSITQRCA